MAESEKNQPKVPSPRVGRVVEGQQAAPNSKPLKVSREGSAPKPRPRD